MMENLNNIWSALTTENLELINITSIPVSIFIEAPLIMYMFIYALNISATRKQKITYIALIAIVGIFTNFVIPSPFNVVFNYGMMFILIWSIFKLSPLKSFVAVIIQIVISALVNVLLLTPFLTLLDITREQAMTIPIYRYVYLILFYLIILFIDLMLKYKNITITILDEFDSKNKSIIFTNLGLGFIAVVFQLIVCYYYANTFPIVVALISFISLLAYFFISIYSLTRVTKLVLTTQELESAEAYNRSLSVLHDNVRGFKHDFDNIVATIGGYVKTNDMEGLKKYYHQLEDDCQRVNNIATLNPNVINNPGIYNLLSSKYHKADEKHIKINLEFFLDLNTLHVKIYEFSRILGILLDNAIDASSECEEKIINIKFRNENKNNRQVVIIENTFNNKDVNTETIFNKGVSSKENHSGLGLWEVRQILKKNNNLNLHTEISGNFFRQQLEIY